MKLININLINHKILFWMPSEKKKVNSDEGISTPTH